MIKTIRVSPEEMEKTIERAKRKVAKMTPWKLTRRDYYVHFYYLQEKTVRFYETYEEALKAAEEYVDSSQKRAQVFKLLNTIRDEE